MKHTPESGRGEKKSKGFVGRLPLSDLTSLKRGSFAEVYLLVCQVERLAARFLSSVT